MANKEHFYKVLSRTNLAFSKSPTKGVVFWYNMLLPESKANTQANEKAWGNLKETFIKEKPSQLNIVDKVMVDLRYIRGKVLKDSSARKKVEELKRFLVESIASEEVLDSVQEYVCDNYDEINDELLSR